MSRHGRSALVAGQMTKMGDDLLSRDHLLGARVVLVQPRRGYRAAIDPVLLAAAVTVPPGRTVLDVGSGAGAAALCLAARVPCVRITGLDADPALVRLATGNAAASGLGERVRFVAAAATPASLRWLDGPFHQVITNPPYLRAGTGRLPADRGKAAATVEGAVGLDGWIDFCVTALAARGTLTMIYRADRLDAVLAALSGRVGGLCVLPLWPGGGKPAKRVIVSGRRGSAAPLRLLPGLTLHRSDGCYTAAAEAVLRHGEGLPLATDAQ